MPQTFASPLHDPVVHAVIERARTGRGAFPVAPEQGDLMYLLCRSTGATRVAEFATSLGVSTLYLAAAVRDNGGGIVIGSEIVAAKAEQARANLNEAGLAEFAEIRIGDARQTFADLGGPIDFCSWTAGRQTVGLPSPGLSSSSPPHSFVPARSSSTTTARKTTLPTSATPPTASSACLCPSRATRSYLFCPQDDRVGNRDG
jgi:hypothetical protein